MKLKYLWVLFFTLSLTGCFTQNNAIPNNPYSLNALDIKYHKSIN